MLSVVVILRFGITECKTESSKHGIYTKTCFNHYINRKQKQIM